MTHVRQQASQILVSRRARLVLALGVGSIPGFALSFTVAAIMPASQADTLLLALSTAVLLGTLLASTYESSLVASFGRFRSLGGRPAASDFGRLQRRSFTLCLPASVIALPTIMLGYFVVGDLHSSMSVFLLTCLPLIAFPVASGQSAVFSAYLTAEGRLMPVFLSVVLRGGPSIVLLLVSAQPILVGAGYALGEYCRFALLRWVALGARQEPAEVEIVLAVPSWRDWGAQIFSMSLAQLSGVVARAFLATAPPGNVTSADNADKIYFASNQIAFSGLILPSVARLPTKLQECQTVSDVRKALCRALAPVVLLSIALAAASVAFLAVLRISTPLPLQEFDRSLFWAQILAIGVPALSLNIWCSRVLLLAGQTSRLIPVSLLMFTSTAVSCASLFALYGPVGIILAIVVTQWIVGCTYLLLAVCGAAKPIFEFFSSTGVVFPTTRAGEL